MGTLTIVVIDQFINVPDATESDITSESVRVCIPSIPKDSTSAEDTVFKQMTTRRPMVMIFKSKEPTLLKSIVDVLKPAKKIPPDCCISQLTIS